MNLRFCLKIQSSLRAIAGMTTYVSTEEASFFFFRISIVQLFVKTFHFDFLFRQLCQPVACEIKSYLLFGMSFSSTSRGNENWKKKKKYKQRFYNYLFVIFLFCFVQINVTNDVTVFFRCRFWIEIRFF